MTTIRLWVFGAIATTIAIVAGGWFLGVQPQLDQAAIADQSRASVVQQNAGYEAALAQLKLEFAGIETKRSEVAALRDAIPAVPADGDFLAELSTVAEETGVIITNVAVSEARPFAPVESGVPPVDAAAPTEADNVTAEADAAAVEPTASTTPIVIDPQLVSAQNFTALPYGISVSGTFEQTVAFVSALQNRPRVFLVTKLTFAPDGDGEGGEEGFVADVTGFIWALSSGGVAPAVEPDPLATAATTPN